MNDIHPGARACAAWWANLLRQKPNPPSTEVGRLPQSKASLLDNLTGRLRANAKAITEEQLEALEQRLMLWLNDRVPEPGSHRLNATRVFVDYEPCQVLFTITEDLGMGDLKYIWPMKATTYLFHEKIEASVGHMAELVNIWEMP